MKNIALRRTLGTVAALSALTVGALAAAAPASAESKDGSMDFNEFGLNFLASQGGSWTDFKYDESLLNNDHFLTTGTGKGGTVDNNAESYFNRGNLTWYVYTGTAANGIEGWIPGDYLGNFSTNFKNQVSSIYNNDAN